MTAKTSYSHSRIYTNQPNATTWYLSSEMEQIPDPNTGVQMTNEKAAAVLASYWARTIPQVGPSDSDLGSVTCSQDFVSQMGLLAQSHTSWDLFSRAYVLRLHVGLTEDGEQALDVVAVDVAPVEVGVPDSYQLEQQSVTTRRAYKLKQMVFANNRFMSAAMFRQYVAMAPGPRALFEAGHHATPTRPQPPTSPPPVFLGVVPSTDSTSTETAPKTTEPAVKATPSKTKASSSSTKGVPSISTHSTRSRPVREAMEPDPSDDWGGASNTLARTRRMVEGTLMPSVASIDLPRIAEDPPINHSAVTAPAVPMRAVNVQVRPVESEAQENVEKMSTFLALEAKLSATEAAGALGSMIKSPYVRDLGGVSSLVKAISDHTSSMSDVAPMLRANCMAQSLDLSCYETDITEMQFIRGLTVASTNVQVLPAPGRQPSYVVAMSFEQFMTYMSRHDAPEGMNHFRPADIDRNWVAVPVSNTMLENPGLLPFIVAHLDSDLWAGSVNIFKRVQFDDPETGATVSTGYTVSMPAVNSVRIPGAHNALLVLLDYDLTNPRLNVHVADLAVPIYAERPNRDNPAPIDIGPTWEAAWTGDYHRLRETVHAAQTAIRTMGCLGQTVHRANALTAELYAAWRPGVALPALDASPSAQFDIQEPALGAYAMTHRNVQGVKIGSTSALLAAPVAPADLDRDEWDRRICGFNFASASSLLLSPTGTVVLAAVPAAVHGVGGAVWATRDPANYIPQYETTMVSSFVRVATYLSLYGTNMGDVVYSTIPAYPAWTHMYSGALAASASLMLATNNVTMREWSGFPSTGETQNRRARLSAMKKVLFNGSVRQVDLQTCMRSWVANDHRTIPSYYILDPMESMDWGSCSPVPTYFTYQWACKLQLADGIEFQKPRQFRHQTRISSGLPIMAKDGLSKVLSAGSFDVRHRRPLIYRQMSPECHAYAIWCDTYAYLSNKAAKSHGTTDMSLASTTTTTVTPWHVDLAYVDEDRVFVVGSIMEAPEPSRLLPVVNPIVWPDPPSFLDIVSHAKNYVALPLVSAVTGWMKAGIPGAVFGAVGTLAAQVVKDLVDARRQKNMIAESKDAAVKEIYADTGRETLVRVNAAAETEEKEKEPEATPGPTQA